MKEYTGGDKIKARALYQDPIEFKPQFKLLLLCNDLPKVPPNDDGVWRRLEVVEFKSKFVDNPNPENPLEFKKDMNLSEKLQEWRESFMSMLLHHYKNFYSKEGILVPQEVIKYTLEFQKTCDAYSEFMDSYIQRIPTASSPDNAPILIADIYDNFSEWYSNTYQAKPPSTKEFKTYLAKKLGKNNMIQQNKYLKGYNMIPYTMEESQLKHIVNHFESNLSNTSKF
jgi:phage/plasmid-associated DNA primase